MQEVSEIENTENSENDISEEEDGMDDEDFISNLEGYLETKGKNEKGNEKDISEGNFEQSNSNKEDIQTIFGGGVKTKIKLLRILLI